MDIEELAQLHKTLSVPVRLKILTLISEKSLCVNAITRFLQISQPAVSQHLSMLRHSGLVRGDKQGYRVHYTLNQSRLDEFNEAVAGFLKENVATRISRGKTPSGVIANRREASKKKEP